MEERSTRTLTATTSGSETLTPAQAQAEGQQQAQSSMREVSHSTLFPTDLLTELWRGVVVLCGVDFNECWLE
jgi:hypothetical protein